MFRIKKLFVFSILILNSNVNADESAFDKTMGSLNKEFRLFQIARKLTTNEKVSAFQFEYPNQGLETDSRQNLRGVTIYINENGRILFVKPLAVKNPLPDQKNVNDAITSSEKISELLVRYNFSKLGEIQKFGLLSKVATAILVRSSRTVVNFDLTDDQKVEVSKLFESKIKIPERQDIVGIEEFFKEVIRYSLY